MMKKCRMIFAASLLFLPSMTVSAQQVKPQKRASDQTTESEKAKRKLDRVVLEAVFRRLLEDHKIEFALQKGKSASISLVSQSTGYWAFRNTDQLRNFREGFDLVYVSSLFKELHKDIQQRNQHPTDLGYVALKSKVIQLRTWGTLMKQPNDEVCVSISLPGYGGDKNFAVVGLGVEKGEDVFRYTCLVVRGKRGWEANLSSVEELPNLRRTPLIVKLYDELCEMDERAIAKADAQNRNALQGRWVGTGIGGGTGQGMGKIILNVESEFAAKYGLTQKQVAMIRRDGYRLKKETEKQP